MDDIRSLDDRNHKILSRRHLTSFHVLSRAATAILEQALGTVPVVVVTGARHDWRTAAAVGDLPVPSHELTTALQRALWFDGYIATYLERE